MNHSPDHDEPTALEREARRLLAASVESVDGRARSRLNQARHAALAGLAPGARPFRVPGRWLPAGALALAAVLAVAVWIGQPGTVAPGSTLAENFSAEDAELLASGEEPELYAEDPEFYEWAESDAAAAGEG
ncbi:MAG: hypothetical protein JSR73_19285 [Proteobacteria bacterium]|nr:hypothetical protein [Pseudomonadota bacterium]